MKVCFVQQAFREQFGIMYLSAMLKQAGHETDIYIYNHDIDIPDADIYAVSSCTPTWKEDKKVIIKLKAITGKKIIVGGPHATFNPDEVIVSRFVDAVCVGEGYEAIVEYAKDPNNKMIKNIYTRMDIFVSTNEVRPLFDINKLPIPDYALYYEKYPQLAAKTTKQVYIVRGCPYQCAFCYNPVVNKMYKDKGNILQYMDIQKAIDEIKELKKTYGFTWLQFLSDTMNLDNEWFIAFLRAYKEQINTPYLCNVRVNKVTEELVKVMKETGCDRIDFGVEHGDEYIRNTVLKRFMPDDMITTAGNLFRKYGIRVQTSNIMGLPEETLDKAIKSVKINQEFKPEIAKCCILQPFVGTDVYNYAKERNLLINEDQVCGTTYQRDFDGRNGITKIKLKDSKRIIRLSYLLDFFVQRPWLNPFIKIIVSLPLDFWYKKAYNKAITKIEKKYR